MRIVQFIRVFGIILLMLCLSVGSYLSTTTYLNFITEIEAYFNAEHASHYINPERYASWPWWVIIPGLVAVSMIIWAGPVSNWIRQLQIPDIQLRSQWSAIDTKIRWGFILLLVINAIARLYLALLYPVSYDEAWTYLHFSSKGFLTSLAYYPLPNNHVLHSLLTSITLWLPMETLISLRLPSLIAATFALCVFFLTFSKWMHPKWALVLSLLFSCLFPFLYYGYLARGYSLLLLSYVVCFYGILEIIRHKGAGQNYQYLFFFSLGLITGVFTIPSFLYAIAGLLIFIIPYLLYISRYKGLIKLITSVILSLVICLILYLPILLVSGIESITHNSFTKPLPTHEVISQLYTHFEASSEFLFAIPLWGIIAVILIIAIPLLVKKHRVSEVLFCLCCILICPVLLLIHSVIPFPRSWMFLIVPILYLPGLFLDRFGNQTGGLAVWGVVGFFIALIYSYSSFMEIQKRERFSFLAEDAYENISSYSPSKVYVYHPLLAIPLRYYSDIRNVDTVYKKVESENDLDSIATQLKHDEMIITKAKTYYLRQVHPIDSIRGELFLYQKNDK